MAELTPYDTGARLEPQLWVRSDQVENAGERSDWLPPADDFGKVDFDDNESTTKLTVWAEHGPAGATTLHVLSFGDDIHIRWE